MKTALLSVSDKTGIVEFAQGLERLGFRILTTGGTFRLLKESGISQLLEVADFTGFPEGLDGRVKTLTPQVFGGILNLRENESHQQFCTENGIEHIDLVVVNLYPFKATYEDPSKSFEDRVENIDIGGPSMIRAAAKNYEYCAPVVDPVDYHQILSQYEEHGDLDLDFRKTLAAKTFAMTAHYDLLIAKFWTENSSLNSLRYGENPHQDAVVVADPFTHGSNLVGAKILNGKPLSFNNFNDANGALELALSFKDKPFAAIIKHASPCGAAIGENLEEAFNKAYEADSISAFGGIIALNRTVTKAVAEKIITFFNEIVLAPSYEPEALEVLRTKKNLRVLEIETLEATPDIAVRKIRGGTLIQSLDLKMIEQEDLEYATKKKPSESEISDLLLAWKIVKIVKSNAIVIVKDGVMIGKGGGQTSRVEAMDIALGHAGDEAKGAVIASDAFFPFPDSVELAGQHGISAIIQPGGAMKDADVFKASDDLGIATVLTRHRAFLH